MKQGQITVFVLLGILLLITVGFAVYTLTVTSDERRVSAEDITSEEEAVTQLNQYLQSCVETSVANATNTVLLQGGVYYEKQNGSVPDTRSAEYSPSNTPRFYDVYYGIRDDYPCSEAHSSPPRYPANYTFFSNYDRYEGSCVETQPPYSTNTVQKYAGFLGVASIPESCMFGSNNQQLPSYVTSRCGSTTLRPENALEVHLENASEDRLTQCINNATLNDRTGNTVSLNGEPDVEVGYATNSTSFYVFLPVEIDVSGGEPTVTRHSFTYQENIPLFTMWRAIHDAMIKEVKEPRYNLSSELTRLDVKTTRQTGTTFYEIQHPEADFRGRDLTVVTAAERRSPVLNKISQTDEPGVDMIIEATQDYQLDPDAIDPDDQYTPVITYDRFGETYTASDASPRMAPANTVEDMTTSDYPERTITDSSNTLSERNGTHTIQEPYSWGKYETDVTASIPNDQEDSQDVTALVVDKPRLKINVSTPTKTGFYIAEAPFTVNGSSSVPPKAFGYRPFYDTNWSLQSNPVQGNPSIIGFTLSDLTTYDPLSIKDELSDLDITPGSATTTLTSSTDTRYINDVRHDVQNTTTVKRCRASGGTGDPYPYNGGTSPYKTTNPCCTSLDPLNQIEGGSTQCFNDQTSTQASAAQTWLDAQETTAEKVPTGDLSSFSQAHSELDEFNDSSDVRVTLTRECGGERGNLCGGDVNINVINESS